MTDIPADILEAAEKALDNMLCNCREAGDVRTDSIRDIASAILAERERCAQVAASWEKTARDLAASEHVADRGFYNVAADASLGIAEDIRTPSTLNRQQP